MNSWPSWPDVNVRAIATQENIRRGKVDALIAINESVIISKRLHQSSGLFLNRIVIAGLGSENGSFDCILVANTMEAAESFDQQKLHTVHFGYRQVVMHLLGESFEQVAVATDRLLEDLYYLRAN
jgi:hypothetical protein